MENSMITATIQARLGSQRLPGKVLKPILDKPMLAHQIERIRGARLIDQIIIATSTSPDDDAIAELGARMGVSVFRGSEQDVLGRVAAALQHYNVDIHVEMLGDSPLADPHLIDEVIGFYLKYQDKYDFVSNDLKVTYPPGMEVKIYQAEALIDISRQVSEDDPLREHVSYHIASHPEKYRLRNLEAPERYRFPEIYLEVDTKEDFKVIESIFGALYPEDSLFSLSRILNFIQNNKEITMTNGDVHRRWKVIKEKQSRNCGEKYQ